jgi:hypothetical protein
MIAAVLRFAARIPRRGGRRRIVAPDGSRIVPTSKPPPDGTRFKALARAWRWQRHARRSQIVPWRGGLRRWAPLGAGIMLLAFLGFGGEWTAVGAYVAGFAVGVLIGLALAHAAGRVPQGPGPQRIYGALACGLFAFAWLLALRG